MVLIFSLIRGVFARSSGHAAFIPIAVSSPLRTVRASGTLKAGMGKLWPGGHMQPVDFFFEIIVIGLPTKIFHLSAPALMPPLPTRPVWQCMFEGPAGNQGAQVSSLHAANAVAVFLVDVQQTDEHSRAVSCERRPP